MAWLAQSAGIASVDITVVSFFNILIGSNWLFIVIAKDITNDLTAFNGSVKLLSHAELMERFLDILQVYLEAKQ